MSVRGEHYLHDEHKPELCVPSRRCGPWRVVECCPARLPDDTDIEECAICGKTVQRRCTFDDDYA